MTNLVILGSSGFLGKYFLNQIIYITQVDNPILIKLN